MLFRAMCWAHCHMQATDLIAQLTDLVEKHGDQDVTVVIPNGTEFSLRDPTWECAGPLVGGSAVQDLPERFVFESDLR